MVFGVLEWGFLLCETIASGQGKVGKQKAYSALKEANWKGGKKKPKCSLRVSFSSDSSWVPQIPHFSACVCGPHSNWGSKGGAEFWPLNAQTGKHKVLFAVFEPFMEFKRKINLFCMVWLSLQVTRFASQGLFFWKKVNELDSHSISNHSSSPP